MIRKTSITLQLQQKECILLKKIISYNLRKLSLLAILAAIPAFTACEKDEDEKPQHDTTFVFGHEALPTDAKITASADSSQVRNVILKSDELSLGGIGTTPIKNALAPKFALSSKVKGKGNLKDVYVMNQSDSLWLVQHGFTVNQRSKEIFTWCIGSPDTISVIATLYMETGKLIISGTGAMKDFTSEKPAPWKVKSNDILTINITSGVTSIGEFAFYENCNVNSVNIPNSIISIGKWSLGRCYKLKSISIPNSVTSIDDYAFFLCTNLSSFTLPEGIISIGVNVLAYCEKLNTIDIPSSVTYIGIAPFMGATSLSSINVNSLNTTFCSENGVLFNKDKTKLIAYPSAKVGAYTIPSTIISTEQNAFTNCGGLTSIIIPSSVASIGAWSFNNCTYLTSIEVDAANSSYSSENGVLFNKDKTILIQYPCAKSGNYNIPSSVSSIYSFAFAYCKELTSLNIPNSVSTIDNFTFNTCTNLIKISTAAATPPSLGYGVFSNINSSCTLKVPVGAKTVYQTADQWKDFSTIEEDASL